MTSESEPHERGNDHPPHLLDERFYVHANQPRNMGAILKEWGNSGKNTR